MGSRKNRGGGAHHHKHGNSNNKQQHNHKKQQGGLTRQQYDQLKVDFQVSELHAVLQAAEESSSSSASSGVVSVGSRAHVSGNSNASSSSSSSWFTWKELAFMLLTMIALVLASITIGVAAGMTISIHYYDDPSASSVPTAASSSPNSRVGGASSGAAGFAHYHRATHLDRDMVARNILSVPTSVPESSRSTASAFSPGSSIMSTSAASPTSLLTMVQEAPPINDVSCSSGSTTHPEGCFLDRSDGDYDGGANLTGSKPSSSDPQYLVDVIHTEATILPSLCPDGHTQGYHDYATLRAAILEVNALSAETFLRWNEYLADDENVNKAFDDPSLYYEEDVLLTLCPGTTFLAASSSTYSSSSLSSAFATTISQVQRSNYAGIFFNAENIIVECETNDCIFELKRGGTHMSFGPHAKNVLIKGVEFRGATTSSITLHHDGADVNFEDCSWSDDNYGTQGMGAVIDVNSTSMATFHRCSMTTTSATKQTGTAAAGRAGGYGKGILGGLLSFLSDVRPSIVMGVSTGKEKEQTTVTIRNGNNGNGNSGNSAGGLGGGSN